MYFPVAKRAVQMLLRFWCAGNLLSAASDIATNRPAGFPNGRHKHQSLNVPSDMLTMTNSFSVRWLATLVLLLCAGGADAKWYDMNPPGSTNSGGMLEEVLSRSTKPQYYRQKYAADVITMSHETAHDVNSRITNDFGGVGMYGFYVGGGKAAVFHEPKILISDIGRRVATRYRNFNQYFNVVGPQQDTFPLYILDEWVAAINGAFTGHELNAGDTGDRYMAAEFSNYANAVIQTVKELDPSYPELSDLEEFVEHEKERTRRLCALPKQPSRAGIGATETFVRASNPQQCAGGNCWSGSASCATCPNGQCPVYQQPARQVVTQPVQQPPAQNPYQKSNDAIAKEWKDYIDVKLANIEGCKCDHSNDVTAASLEITINQLRAELTKSTANINTRLDELEKLAKSLDHETPIRVYLPNGKLVGETQTNLFRSGSIDFTFDPRALLDEANH